MMLYWGSGSPPCWRVQIALEEKNLQGYHHKLLSFDKGEQKSEEVMKLNPRGQVSGVERTQLRIHYAFMVVSLFLYSCIQLPTFKHGDVVVNESVAACVYLEVRVDFKGTVASVCRQVTSYARWHDLWVIWIMKAVDNFLLLKGKSFLSAYSSTYPIYLFITNILLCKYLFYRHYNPLNSCL